MDKQIIIYLLRYPVGHFVRALGKLGDKSTENEVSFSFHSLLLDVCLCAAISYLCQARVTRRFI